jgi:2,3,4,5-tetrahydropyridine-2-carboxylate N-succinyltransferase
VTDTTNAVASPLDPALDELWERRDGLSPDDADARALVHAALDELDSGKARVAWVDPATDAVVVDERAKRSILLAFKTFPMTESAAGDFAYRDRMPLKTRLDGVRTVPGAIVRFGAYLAPGVVCMPSYVNVGGYVDEGTLVDTWATVGSSAQVGKRVHLSGGVGLGGVLEPASAVPVVIEDDAFIGSRSMVVEGARVRKGAKLGAGVILTSSTHVVDATTGEEYPRGEAPARGVCVGSTRVKSFPGGDFGMPVVLVLRTLAENEIHDKLALNDVLREHGVST